MYLKLHFLGCRIILSLEVASGLIHYVGLPRDVTGRLGHTDVTYSLILFEKK